MDLIIKEVKEGPFHIEYKLIPLTDKARFVTDHFRDRDNWTSKERLNKLSYGILPTVRVQKYDLDMVYKLIKLAGDIYKGFNYELKEVSEYR